MKRFIIIIYLLSTLLISQNRSVIFNTGSPDNFDSGHIIDINNSIANRITINNDYVLEAMAFYMTATNSNTNNIKITLREDNDGIPGALVSDLSQWDHQIDLMHAMNYNLIVTTNLCIYLEKDNYYWWVIEAGDENTQASCIAWIAF